MVSDIQVLKHFVKIVFSISKVGSDMYRNTEKSMVYFKPFTDKMYFHFWRGGSSNQESATYKRILNEWYKLQLIQSTYDGQSCRQSLKVNDRYVWQKHVRCPTVKPGVQEIYTCGSSTDQSKAQIRNFKFFSKPL